MRVKKCESKKNIAEEQTPPKQLREYFTPATCDSPTSTCMPVAMAHLGLSIPSSKWLRPFIGESMKILSRMLIHF